MSMIRTKWAAVGAAVAVTLGAGGVSLSQAALTSGEKPVFVPIEPCRLIDTRPATQIGPKSTPLGPNETITLAVTGSTGQCSGIPADATGAAMNMTAIQPTAQSFLTVYPSDADRPNASNLNWAAGDPPTPNKVDVKLGADGAVEVFNSVGTAHLAADLVGYYIDHHHDDRYYKKAEVNSAFVPHGEIVMRHGTSEMTPNAGGPPSSVQNYGSATVVSGDGHVNISPTGPATIGGIEYGLKSVEYCIDQVSSAQIDLVTIWSEPPSGDVNDHTDRLANGCYTVVANLTGAHAYDVQFRLKNGGSLRFAGLQTTWAPASEIPTAAS